MFIIRCENCGREQQWGVGVKLGEGTEIEVAGRAIYCSCGTAVEEQKGELKEIQA